MALKINVAIDFPDYKLIHEMVNLTENNPLVFFLMA